MPKPKTLHGTSARKNTNQAIFKRCGLSLLVAYRLKGMPDKQVINYLESTLGSLDVVEQSKVKEAIRLINERSKKIWNKNNPEWKEGKKNAAT